MKLPAVNACIEIISDSIAKMPVYLMDSGTRERVTDHPALRLLTSRPTEALTAFDYHKLMESRRIAYGNATRSFCATSGACGGAAADRAGGHDAAARQQRKAVVRGH